jgi:hypothetical protein
MTIEEAEWIVAQPCGNLNRHFRNLPGAAHRRRGRGVLAYFPQSAQPATALTE